MSAEEVNIPVPDNNKIEERSDDALSDSESKIKGDQSASEKNLPNLGEDFTKGKDDDGNNSGRESEGALSRASSRGSSPGAKDGDNRPKSSASDASSKGRRKKTPSVPPGAHRVTFTVSIAMAIPTG